MKPILFATSLVIIAFMNTANAQSYSSTTSYGDACTLFLTFAKGSPDYSNAVSVGENIMQNWLAAGIINGDSYEGEDDKGDKIMCLRASSESYVDLVRMHMWTVLSSNFPGAVSAE